MTDMISDIDALYHAAQGQHVWETLPILADWYEENNAQGMADCLRWCVTNCKRPYLGSAGWYWFLNNTPTTRYNDPASDLPAHLFHALSKGFKEEYWTSLLKYESFKLAMEDLFQVWENHRELFYRSRFTVFVPE